MRFLVDENLPPTLAALLTESGHDATHVRDVNARAASDPQIVELAREDDRVIVSADTDFGALLAQARATTPSVILVREIVHLRPPELAKTIIEQLETVGPHLHTGAMVAISARGTRIRKLPLR